MVQYFDAGGDAIGGGGAATGTDTVVTPPNTTTYQGPLTLTLDDIRNQLLALDAQLIEQGFEAGTDAYIAAQEQARAEFVKFFT